MGYALNVEIQSVGRVRPDECRDGELWLFVNTADAPLVCERAYKLLRKNRMKRAIRAFVKEWKD